MLVRRWQAPKLPTKEQIKFILEAEGLEPYEQVYDPTFKTKEHRSPFEEIRFLASGELLFNVAGNQLLLRPGDRIEIPSNTKRSHQVKGDEPCVCICAQRPF